MKKLFCALCLLLMLALCVPVCAESTAIPADDDDLVSMLEGLFQDGEDFCYYITLNRERKIIVIELAIDGLVDDVLEMKEAGLDETFSQWATLRKSFLKLHSDVLEVFRTVHRDDMRLIFNIVNDDAYLREDYSTIKLNPLISIGIFGNIDIDVMAE